MMLSSSWEGGSEAAPSSQRQVGFNVITSSTFISWVLTMKALSVTHVKNCIGLPGERWAPGASGTTQAIRDQWRRGSKCPKWSLVKNAARPHPACRVKMRLSLS